MGTEEQAIAQGRGGGPGPAKVIGSGWRLSESALRNSDDAGALASPAASLAQLPTCRLMRAAWAFPSLAPV